VSLIVGPSNVLLPGELWVADPGADAVIHFPPFAKLSQTSAPDGSLQVNTPLSPAYDAFGNLVVADNTNRILYFVPSLTIKNGANFLTRAPAPGSIVSVFPGSTNSPAVLGTSTVNFNSLPNPLPVPTVLGDTQVMVNSQPAPLFYVSPGQINMVLPMNLPTTGTVNMQVVSQSTGQIYGATDLAVTSASPGLFTLNAQGYGQLSALNDDNTVNGPGNPLTRGHIIQIFGTGQGAVMNAPPDGTPPTGLAPSLATPQVQISTIMVPPENIIYSGLAPGLVGVWQIDILVPTTVTAGSAMPVMINLNSVPSNDPASTLRATIALQ
jgi:uncharacterized protein (TIGR03437 family)